MPSADEPTDPQHFRRPESVLVVVYTPQSASIGQRVLMLERVHPKGFWQSVTGSLLWGESPLDCARRELHEETGIGGNPQTTGQVNRFEIMPGFHREQGERYAPGVRFNTEHVFSQQLEQACVPLLNPQEHCAYEWLEASEAIARCFSYTNAEAIEAIVLAEK